MISVGADRPVGPLCTKKMRTPLNFDSYTLCAAIRPERYELLIAQWLLLGMQGCEESENLEGMRVRVYFADEVTARDAARMLQEEEGATDIAVEKVEPQDWNAKWRASMKPARLARGYWVSPIWLEPPKSAKHWIKIEPKMAFGTGHHETTRLAAATIIAQKRNLKGRRILDIGTGSGGLCFVADICGAARCLGIEIDSCCRENLAENYRQNVPAGQIDFIIGSANALKNRQLFDCVVMNMLITESSPLLERVATALRPGGLLVWSGILTDERNEATGLAQNSGFFLEAEKSENEWWCGVFKKRVKGEE